MGSYLFCVCGTRMHLTVLGRAVLPRAGYLCRPAGLQRSEELLKADMGVR